MGDDEANCEQFAIRPTIRNHGKILTRDYIIQTVASIVGPGHSVDLNNPDVIILVDVYKVRKPLKSRLASIQNHRS
jgi:tRNA(Ser,Leu) C12 N-acetylase TAN1